jgi:hypothetical protein
MQSLRSKLVLNIVPFFLISVILVIGIMAGIFAIDYFFLKELATDDLITYKKYNLKMYASEIATVLQQRY